MYTVENYLLHMNAVMGEDARTNLRAMPVTRRCSPTTIHEVDINYSGVAEQFIGVIIVYRHFRRPWCGSRSQKFSRNSRPPDRLLSRAVISFH